MFFIVYRSPVTTRTSALRAAVATSVKTAGSSFGNAKPFYPQETTAENAGY